jgi:ATP-dependent DNA ligase
VPIVGVDHVQLAMPAGREAEAHISRFEWLRARPKDGRATLPVYMVFDVLELDGKDWRPEPLWKRRQVLEELVAKERMILPVRRLSSNGLKAWAQAAHKGYEGIVAKDPQSPYVGGRTLKWLKVKQPNYRVEERGWDPRNKS